MRVHSSFRVHEASITVARSRRICQSVQSLIGSIGDKKPNEMNDLTHRFSVAPMMDWSETSQKAKYDQDLREVTVRHAVPNAVPSELTIFSNKILFQAAFRGGKECVSADMTAPSCVNFTRKIGDDVGVGW